MICPPKPRRMHPTGGITLQPLVLVLRPSCSASACIGLHHATPMVLCSAQRCSMKTQAAEQMLGAKMNDFHGRISRCAARCEDLAKETMGSEPSQKVASKAQVRIQPSCGICYRPAVLALTFAAALQEQMSACVTACFNEYRGKVPALKAELQAGLNQVKQQ